MKFPHLSEKEALILRILVASGESYGFGLVKTSQGQLKPGTIYVTLNRMEEKGYVASKRESTPKGPTGSPRRVYWAEDWGKAALRAHEAAQRAFAHAASGLAEAT